MESWRRNLWILWFGVILSAGSYTMVVPFLPLYLLKLGVDNDSVKMWSGVVFSITFLVGAIMAPVWGSLADKYGKRQMVIRAGLSLVLVYALGAIVQNPWEMLGVRVLHGLVSGFVPASIAIVATNTPEEHMGWSLGVMETAGATGSILGPLIGGGLSAVFGMRLSFVVASVMILFASLLVWKFVVEENFVKGKPKSRIADDLKEAWHNRPLMQMLTLLVVVQIAFVILQPLLTLYVADMQGGTEGAEFASGIVFSVAGIATCLAAPQWGKIGQKRGYILTLLLGLFFAGGLNMMQVFTHNIWSFSVVRFLSGLFIAGVLPAINAIIVDRTEPNFRGRAFGLATSANQVGAMIGPLIGGWLGGWLGIQFVFVLTGVMLLATCFTFWSLSKRKRPEQQPETQHIAM
ncbi:MAG: MFS transporter [Tumebacillaceae bacterium]